MQHGHILIVEDETKIAGLLTDYLVRAGFSVSRTERGDRVISLVKTHNYDLILLDLMLPGKEGTEVCREIRTQSDIPIIMITARVEEAERITGLSLGADDYICKPFSPREVVARVQAVLRRSRAGSSSARIVAGPLSINEETRSATINDRPLQLTPSEFTLLKTLAGRPDRVFSREELMNRIQGYQIEGYERTIDTHVKNLRKKIAEFREGKAELIQTVYGVGYKLVIE
jgi:two-component system response regulator BaeR